MKKRDQCLDIVKGIAMTLVMAGHVGFGREFSIFIHAFHVPIFFFITGYLTANATPRPLREVFWRKTKSLLIPFLVFALLHIGLYYVMRKLGFISFTESPFYYFVFTTLDGGFAGLQWFLLALYFAILLYSALCKIPIKTRLARTGIVVVLSLFGVAISWFKGILLPFALAQALVALLFIESGRIFAESINFWKDIPPYLLGLFMVLTTIFIFANGPVNLRTQAYSIIPLFFLNAILASAIVIALIQKIPSGVQRFLSPFVFIGNYSLIYLCTNELAIMATRKLAGALFGQQRHFLLSVAILATSLLLCAIPSIVLRPILKYLK